MKHETTIEIVSLAGSENDQSNWQISHLHVGDTSQKYSNLDLKLKNSNCGMQNAEKDK